MSQQKMQNLRIWLMDDQEHRFTGAHVTAKQPLSTRAQWKSLGSEFADLVGDLNCSSGSTDGLYILSSSDNSASGSKDILITRAFGDRNIDLNSLSLPRDTIGFLSIVTQSPSRYGVMALHSRALGNKGKATIMFALPTTVNSKTIDIDTPAKVALLAMSHGLHTVLAKV